MTNSNPVGKNLKKLRALKKMTQKQLAEKTGLAVITIQNYEAGKYTPKIENLSKIATALGVSVHDLTLYSPSVLDIFAGIDANSEELARKINEDNKKEVLVYHFYNLNENGQKKAIEQVELLTRIPEYQKKEETE